MNIAEFEAISGWTQSVMIMSGVIPFLILLYTKLAKSVYNYFGVFVLLLVLMIATLPMAAENLDRVPVGYKNVRARDKIITVDDVDEATYNNWLTDSRIDLFIGKRLDDIIVFNSTSELENVGAEWINGKLVIDASKLDSEYRLERFRSAISRSLAYSYILVAAELASLLFWKWANKKEIASKIQIIDGDTIIYADNPAEARLVETRLKLELMQKLVTR